MALPFATDTAPAILRRCYTEIRAVPQLQRPKHDTTTRMMVYEFVGRFDPALVQAIQRCASQFEKTFKELAD